MRAANSLLSCLGRKGLRLFAYLTTDPKVVGALAWVSLAITLLGFAVAIWQIVKTKRAANAARDAALGLEQRVRSRELLAKLGDAHNHLYAAGNHIVFGRRETVSLCLELSKGSIIEAIQLSRGVGGDWTELRLLVDRLRVLEGRFAVLTEPMQNDPEFLHLRFLLRDAAESLQQCAAQARYAYDLPEVWNGNP